MVNDNNYLFIIKSRIMRTKNVESPEINASSMADIAFLLLIFFLVTTTMDIDKGILVTLPEYTDKPPPITTWHDRDVLEVLVNGADQLLVENKEMDIMELKNMVKKHVANPLQEKNFATSSQKAIVLLQNDAATSYKTYINVQNEIRAAYNELREEKSQETYSKSFDVLTKDEKKVIREIYPLKMSEANTF